MGKGAISFCSRTLTSSIEQRQAFTGYQVIERAIYNFFILVFSSPFSKENILIVPIFDVSKTNITKKNENHQIVQL